MADAVKDSGALRNAMGLSGTDWLYGPPRELGLLGKVGVAGVLRGVPPVFDALDAARRASGWGLGGLLDAVGRVDFDAIRRAADREARVREARRPRTRTGFAALEAYDAFYLGHPWVADAFLTEHLGIEPDEDRREALWLVLRWTFERNVPRPAKWLVIDDEGAVRYLRAAVHKNARRVRRDKERPDRVWWEERDPATKKKVELPPPTLQPEYTLEFMMKISGNPADLVVPPPDDRGRTRKPTALDAVLSGLRNLLRHYPEVFSERQLDAVGASLENLLEDTQLPGHGAGDREGHPAAPLPAEWRPLYRWRAAQLAYRLARAYAARDGVVPPEVLQRWEQACIEDPLPEVRMAWR